MRTLGGAGGLLVPLAAAVLGLLGAAGASGYLYRAGSAAVEQALEARLSGAGQTAAALLGEAPSSERLESLRRAEALEGAYLVDGALAVVADAAGGRRPRIDLLRTDEARVRQALAGTASVATGYALGELEVMSGYFPVRGAEGTVLVLEAGRAFVQPRRGLRRALLVGGGLSVGVALMLALVAGRYVRFERLRREGAAAASRGETLAKLAAVAAHEIRNPLGVMRGTIELMRERAGPGLDGRTREALEDLMGEVERLRRLTEDLLDLAADRPLQRSRVDLAQVLEGAARAAEAAHPKVQIRREWPQLPPVAGDTRRLHQVFLNLLLNAAQAQGEGEVALRAQKVGAQVVARVEDRGPGVPEELKGRLFELFVTTKSGGSGLGLALSRRLIERHGGSLELVSTGPGATFEVRLPAAQGESE